MSFYHSRDINLTLNGRTFFANSASLSQEASLINPILEGDLTSKVYVPSGPVNNSLKINYYLTGQDYLKDFIFLDHRINITGNIGGVQFSNGYLESYNLSAEQHSPVNISASIKVCDELVGTFNPSSSAYYPPNLEVWNFKDAYFNLSNFSTATLPNITRFDWNYSADVLPVYYANQTGLSKINADRVIVGEKNISCDIRSDNTQLPLGFTGENFAIEFACQPSNRSTREIYTVSGQISKKTFSISSNSVAESVYSISEAHVNEVPKIGSYSDNFAGSNSIQIISRTYPNKFYTLNNNFCTVIKVTLGGVDLPYTVSRGSSDSITADIPLDGVNGYLNIETTKGLLQYAPYVTLAYPAPVVSGFFPPTGAEHALVTLSGANFYRVSDVKLGSKSCVFDVISTTGVHKINVYIPSSPRVGTFTVYSVLRNTQGSSSTSFAPQMEITSFNPATGTWSGIVNIVGQNFFGITDVSFNGIRSPNFTQNGQTSITARTPMTGQGNPKGYITISGYQGSTARSRTIYQPILKITGVSLLSGRPDNDIAISGVFDSGLLYWETGGNAGANGGYRVAFGNEYSIFQRQGNVNGVGGSNFILTGYVPLATFTSASPAMVEPDGVTKYTAFPGKYIQIGKPIIDTVNGDAGQIELGLFNKYALTLKGKNFNYLFGNPYSVIVSGEGYSGSVGYSSYSKDVISTYGGNDVSVSSDGTVLQVVGVRMTGNLFQEDIRGRIAVVNYAGTGWFPQIIKFNRNITTPDIPTYASILQIPSGAQNFQEFTLFTYGVDLPLNDSIGRADNIIAAQVDPFAVSYTNRFGKTLNPIIGVNTLVGYVDYFWDPPIDFGGIYIEKKNIPINDYSLTFYTRSIPYGTFGPFLLSSTIYDSADTGVLLGYQGKDTIFSLAFTTGIVFSTSPTAPTKIFKNSEIITGIRKIRLYRNDSDGGVTSKDLFIGLSRIMFFD